MGLGNNLWEMDLPDNIPLESYGYRDGVEYRAIDTTNDYFVSNEGEIISFVSGRPKILKTWPNQHGHRMLRTRGDRKIKLVHRLVAEAFVPNPEGYPIVRHLDDDPENNYYRNLAWGTQKDNRDDSVRNGNDFRKEVYCYEDDRYFRSCADAARYYGIDKPEMTLCCQGNVHAAKGKHFCYADELDKKLKDTEWLKERTQFKPVIAIAPDGTRRRYNSRKEAAEDLGIPDCGISSVLTGHLKHTHGWRFEEADDGETD